MKKEGILAPDCTKLLLFKQKISREACNLPNSSNVLAKFPSVLDKLPAILIFIDNIA